jgi:hypothetical protein
MKEKVMYVNLPNGANYQRVEVTEDAKVAIVYTPAEVKIPKPIPLIGGTEVYQKDNGTPYWYCKIKGRDEFMHVYFEDLTEDDLLYDANGKKRKFKKGRPKEFKNDVLKALKNKPVEGYCWIPVFEPSMLRGNLQYVSGAEVLINLTSFDWEDLFNKYSPENGSKQATCTTYFLLLLRWLKDGIATVEQLTRDSKEIGHYWDSENAKKNFEKTGEREFGGLYGFVGNTCKIVKDSESSGGFSIVGGDYDHYGWPLSFVFQHMNPFSRWDNGVGLLELTK